MAIRMRWVFLPVAAVAVAVAGWLLLGLEGDDRVTDSGQALAAPKTERPPSGEKVLKEKPARPLVKAGEMNARELPIPKDIPRGDRSFELPDGSRLPVLNGAYGAPKMMWPRELPYSPVVRRFVGSEGIEWYAHADGSFSTTLMLWRSDLGRKEAVTHLVNPGDPLPMQGQESKSPAKKNKAKK